MDPSWKKTLKISGNYVSCIKMNGVPLLPPLMSQEYRQEMQYYKQLAVALEQRLSDLQSFLTWQSPSNSTEDDAEKNETHDYDDCQQDDKVSLHDVDLVNLYKNKSNPGHNVDEDDILPEKEKKCSKHNGGNYPLDLNIMNAHDVTRTENLHRVSNETIVIDESFPSQPKLVNNSNSNSCKESESTLLANNNETFTNSVNISRSPIKVDLTASPPKLVRQNSYVLESPGPLLQAHLQVQSMYSGVDVLAISMSDSTLSKEDTAAKRRSWDFEMAKEAWSSIDSLNLTSNSTPSRSAKSKADTIAKAKVKPNSKSLHNSPAKSREQPTVVGKKRSPYSSKLDSSPKTLTKTPSKSSFKECESSEKDSNNKRDDIIPHIDRIQMQRILHNMQKDFMIKMSQLIAKQKEEQYYMQKNFEQQRMVLLKKLPGVPRNLILTLDSEPSDVMMSKHNPSINKLSPNMCNPEKDINISNKYGDRENEHTILSSNNEQSEGQKSFRSYNTLDDINNFTLNSDDNQSWVGSPRVNDLHSTVVDITNTLRAQNQNMSTIEINAQNKCKKQSNCIKEHGYESLDVSDFMDKNFIVAYKNESTINHTPRESSPRKGSKSLGNEIDTKRLANERGLSRFSDQAREHYEACNRPMTKKKILIKVNAATTIVAYARGYLVRRLLRTDRVQNIVHTIRDALVCALELHRDSDGIHGADVDLHRRLIQQITAACYTLHETFFTISINDRMEIISQDRERLQVQALRQANPPPLPLIRKPSPVMTRSLPAQKKIDPYSDAKTRNRLSRFSSSSRNVSEDYKLLETMLSHGKRLRCAPVSPGTITN